MNRDDQIIESFRLGETLSQIGTRHDLTKERIRQIINLCLTKDVINNIKTKSLEKRNKQRIAEETRQLYKLVPNFEIGDLRRLNLRKLHEKYKISIKKLSRIRSLLNIHKPRSTTKFRDKEQLIKLYNSGVSYKEMATQVGSSTMSAHRACQRLIKIGLVAPRKRARRSTVGNRTMP